MKKFINILIVFIILFSGIAYGQQTQLCKIRDSVDRTLLVNVRDFTLTFPATRIGTYNLSGTYFYDGANMRWWLGAQANSDAVAATTYAPYTLTLNMGFDFTNTLWKRIRTDTDGALITNQLTAFPGYSRDQDGASLVVKNILENYTDGLALTLNGAMSAAVGYGYNGATLDMFRMSATNGLIINQENIPVSEDAGNAWQAGYKKAVNTLHPPLEAVSTAAGVATTVLASVVILGWPNVTIYLDNVDAAHDLTDADVQVSPNGTAWVSLTWTDCDTLGFGTACVYQLNNQSYRYLRVQATDDGANPVDIEAWITGNLN